MLQEYNSNTENIEISIDEFIIFCEKNSDVYN